MATMALVLHGAAGGWDELAIAAVALAVLWIAVKLAGRKPASGQEDDETSPLTSEAVNAVDEPVNVGQDERSDPVHPSPTKPV